MAAPATDPLATLILRAEGQHGLVTRDQATASGLSPEAWRHQLRTGGWERVTHRVARRAGSVPTASQRALAAVLDVGPCAYLSHRSAVALWGVPGFSLEPLEVMVARHRRTPCVLATVHHPRHLPDPFAAVLDGIPVVRPALALLQIAPFVHPLRLQRALDWLWTRRLVSGPSLRQELAPVLRRGRAGTTALRTLLDGLPPGYVPPASGLEGRFATILSRAGLPALRRQVDLGDGQRWCGRVDFVAPDRPLVIEVQSERYHTALSDRQADAQRRARLEQAGFTVIEVEDHDIWHRPAAVVTVVGAAWRAAA